MMATAFLGYVLPYGQMSIWGATVITNLLGDTLCRTRFCSISMRWISVSNATLNRFFSLHYLLPFILAALALLHMITLHQHGSSNPNGVTGNVDRVPMHPYFMF